MREQYSFAKIIGIWALAAAPMGILSWIVFPLLAPDFESDPLAFGVTRVALLTLGLIWLFVLSMIIVRREEGDLRWASVKRRLRLNTPREPATGQPRARLFLWVVLFLVAVALVELVLRSPIQSAWVSVFPSLSGRAVAQDGRCVWSLQLGGKRCTLRFLSRSPALGNTGQYPHRSFVHLP